MGNIGSSELLLILILALLLLGPRRLPEVGSALGRMVRRFRQASRELRDEMDVGRSLRLDDLDDPPARQAPDATQARAPDPAATTPVVPNETAPASRPADSAAPEPSHGDGGR